MGRSHSENSRTATHKWSSSLLSGHSRVLLGQNKAWKNRCFTKRHYLKEEQRWLFLISISLAPCFAACQEHYRQIGRIDLLYECYLQYGDGYASIDRMAKSLEYYQEMLKIAEQTDRDEWKAQALFKIGTMNNKLGKVEPAIAVYGKGFRVCRSLQ